MSCNKSKIGNCGCGTKPLATIEDYDGYAECQKEPCSELFSDECILHIQENMIASNGTKTLSINKGDRLSEVLQKISVAVMNPTVNPDSIPTGLRVSSITKNSITISWNVLPNTLYKICYKSPTDTSYTEVSVEGDEYTISNLKTLTTYSIKVLNSTNNIESITLNVKTN